MRPLEIEAVAKALGALSDYGEAPMLSDGPETLLDYARTCALVSIAASLVTLVRGEGAQ